MHDELIRDLLNVNEKDKGTYGEALRAAAAERIAELEAENRRLREALDAFWTGSLVIESSVRRTEGKGSPVYQNVLAAILKAQEFYKNLPKAARAALSQEEKP